MAESRIFKSIVCCFKLLPKLGEFLILASMRSSCGPGRLLPEAATKPAWLGGDAAWGSQEREGRAGTRCDHLRVQAALGRAQETPILWPIPPSRPLTSEALSGVSPMMPVPAEPAASSREPLEPPFSW